MTRSDTTMANLWLSSEEEGCNPMIIAAGDENEKVKEERQSSREQRVGADLSSGGHWFSISFRERRSATKLHTQRTDRHVENSRHQCLFVLHLL
jgi:hypothetical protein